MPQFPFSQETARIIAECRATREHARSEIAEITAETRKIIIESQELMAEVDAVMARRMLLPASARMSDRQSPLPLTLIGWDIYPPLPRAIRLGEVEAADAIMREITDSELREWADEEAREILSLHESQLEELDHQRREALIRELAHAFYMTCKIAGLE